MSEKYYVEEGAHTNAYFDMDTGITRGSKSVYDAAGNVVGYLPFEYTYDLNAGPTSMTELSQADIENVVFFDKARKPKSPETPPPHPTFDCNMDDYPNAPFTSSDAAKIVYLVTILAAIPAANWAYKSGEDWIGVVARFITVEMIVYFAVVVILGILMELRQDDS